MSLTTKLLCAASVIALYAFAFWAGTQKIPQQGLVEVYGDNASVTLCGEDGVRIENAKNTTVYNVKVLCHKKTNLAIHIINSDNATVNSNEIESDVQ